MCLVMFKEQEATHRKRTGFLEPRDLVLPHTACIPSVNQVSTQVFLLGCVGGQIN